MKKMIIGLLALTSASAFAQSNQDHFCKGVFEQDFDQKRIKLHQTQEKAGIVLNLVGMIRYDIAYTKFDKAKERILLSKSIELSELSREEIVLQDPDMLGGVMRYRGSRLKEINEVRGKAELPKLSEEEFEVIYPFSLSITQHSGSNKIDRLTTFINNNSKVKVTYDELIQFLADQKFTNYFCRDGVPFQLSQKNIGQLVRDIKNNTR